MASGYPSIGGDAAGSKLALLDLVNRDDDMTITGKRHDFRIDYDVGFDDDGRVKSAECTCTFFRKHKLKEGPCAHLIALRVAQAQEEERRRQAYGAGRSIEGRSARVGRVGRNRGGDGGDGPEAPAKH